MIQISRPIRHIYLIPPSFLSSLFIHLPLYDVQISTITKETSSHVLPASDLRSLTTFKIIVQVVEER